jgi:hypothetical protein
MAWCGWAHSAWMSPQEMQKGRGARTGTKRGKEIPRGWTNWDGTCPTLGKSMCPEPQDSLERWKVNESDKSHSSSGKIGFLSCWGSLLRSSWAHPFLLHQQIASKRRWNKFVWDQLPEVPSDPARAHLGHLVKWSLGSIRFSNSFLVRVLSHP